MTSIQFLAEWALRSTVLIVAGAVVLTARRKKDPAIQLAAWTAMLCGSLAIPVLTAVLPRLPIAVFGGAAPPVIVHETPLAATDARQEVGAAVPGVVKQVDWTRYALAIYLLVTVALLLRLCVGLAMSLRLLRASRSTGRKTEGIEIREPDRVSAPLAMRTAWGLPNFTWRASSPASKCWDRC